MIFNITFANISCMNQLSNLLHLKFFCDAVAYESISEAAKINFVSQSAVSQAIVKLEKVFNAPLLIHSRQKFQPTEEGQIVFEQARQVFKAIQNIHDKIGVNKEVITGSLKFVTTKSLGVSFLAARYKKIQKALPEVTLCFPLGGLNYIRNMLRQSEAEFGLVVYDENFSQFNKIPIRKGRFNLYQSIDAPHHLIENGILVDYYQGTHVPSLQEYIKQSDSPHLAIQTELAGWDMVSRFTEMGIGVGFLPDYLVTEDRRLNIKPHPFEIPEFEYQICAIYNKGEKLSRAAMTVIEELSEGDE